MLFLRRHIWLLLFVLSFLESEKQKKFLLLVEHLKLSLPIPHFPRRTHTYTTITTMSLACMARASRFSLLEQQTVQVTLCSWTGCCMWTKKTLQKNQTGSSTSIYSYTETNLTGPSFSRNNFIFLSIQLCQGYYIFIPGLLNF